MAKKKNILEEWPEIFRVFREGGVDVYVNVDRIVHVGGLTREMESILKDRGDELIGELRDRGYYIPAACWVCGGGIFCRREPWEGWVCKRCHPPVKVFEEVGEEACPAKWPGDIAGMVQWLDGFDLPGGPFGRLFTVTGWAYEGVADPGVFRKHLLDVFRRYGPGQGPHRYGRPEEDLRFLWDRFCRR